MSFGGGLVLLIICQLVLLSVLGLPFRTVVFPHDNSGEIGADPEPAVGRLVNNRKFSDQSSQYIPFLLKQLQGNHSRWIATWNPHQQLGHPLPQLGGLGKAYPLTHAASLFVSDPLRLFSLLFHGDSHDERTVHVSLLRRIVPLTHRLFCRSDGSLFQHLLPLLGHISCHGFRDMLDDCPPVADDEVLQRWLVSLCSGLFLLRLRMAALLPPATHRIVRVSPRSVRGGFAFGE